MKKACGRGFNSRQLHHISIQRHLTKSVRWRFSLGKQQLTIRGSPIQSGYIRSKTGEQTGEQNPFTPTFQDSVPLFRRMFPYVEAKKC